MNHATLFVDGPAKDVTLNLKRAPVFLRVTLTPQIIPPKWDALDLLDDEPNEFEKLYAYELTGTPIRGMIDGAKYRGPFLASVYRVVTTQPSDETMRSRELWRDWCNREAPARKGLTSKPEEPKPGT